MGNQTAILQWKAETEQTHNPFRYCGEYQDAETGLIYLRARYYDPYVPRFKTMDTHWNVDNMIYGDKEYKEGEIRVPDTNAIMQANNLYVYCINDPVDYVDPMGNAGKKRYVDNRKGNGYYTFLAEKDNPDSYGQVTSQIKIDSNESASNTLHKIEYVAGFYNNILLSFFDVVGTIIGLMPDIGVRDEVGRTLNVNVGDVVYTTQRVYHIDGVQYTEVEYKITNGSGRTTFHDAYLFTIFN